MSLDAEDIRNEKVKVLRSMKTVTLDDVVIGQYRSRAVGGKTLPGYLDDKTVPKGRCVSYLQRLKKQVLDGRNDRRGLNTDGNPSPYGQVAQKRPILAVKCGAQTKFVLRAACARPSAQWPCSSTTPAGTASRSC